MCPCLAQYLLILLRARLSTLFCNHDSVVIPLQVGGKGARSLIEHREQIGLINEDVMEIDVGYIFSFSLPYALQIETENLHHRNLCMP